MDDQRLRVLELMAAWGYAPGSIGEIRPILDVFRVETTAGPMNLKWTRHPNDKLNFILSALRHLYANGFRSFRLPEPTMDGAPFLVRDGQHYTLSPWIEGVQADLANPEHLAASCRTLARFHLASAGYRPPEGPAMRARWGSLIRSFTERCRELEDFPARAVSRRELSGFDQAVRLETDYYLSLARFARDLLARSAYRELAAEAQTRGSLCHGDVAARNFILTPGGEVCLIDFDAIRQDLRVTDLWKLLRRTMKTFLWAPAFGLRLLADYESVAPLEPRELEVLLALTAFPQKFWRLANRYYGGQYRIEEDKFYRKLRKYTEQRRAHAIFLARLTELCRARGCAENWPPCPFAVDRAVGV